MKKNLHSFFYKPLSVCMVITTLLVLCVGCYRMPSDDDYSLVPTTNNPDITGDRGSGLAPGGNF